MKNFRALKHFSLIAAVCLISAVASAQFTTVVNFNGSNGGEPMTPLTQGVNGNIFGTSFEGGATSGGTFFEIGPDATLTNLYHFCVSIDCSGPAAPNGGLLLASDGNFYGTSYVGGGSTWCNGGCGTIFKITPEGQLTTIYSFCSQPSCPDGSNPNGSLIEGSNGNFYGTTLGGDCQFTRPSGCGTFFEISPGGKLTTLYTFCPQLGCPDGELPSSLMQASDGNFYGTTQLGGGTNYKCGDSCGTIFELTPAGKLTTVHKFIGKDGGNPDSPPVQGIDGNFYGTTPSGGLVASKHCALGCGTAFQVTPSGKFTTIYLFCSKTGCPDGVAPFAQLVAGADGNLYGTSGAGKSSETCIYGCGTIFKLTTTGDLTTLYTFDNADGSLPTDLMQATDGNFYGGTYEGGSSNCQNGCGTVFSLSAGLPPFVQPSPSIGRAGTKIIILGNGLTGATAVTFNGEAASFTVVSDTEITAVVPAGATSGKVEVITASGVLKSNAAFVVAK